MEAVRRSPPDLVLLDIVMPDIDGYEVCRRLRAAEETRELPIMFLSSLEDVADKARGFEVGGNDYLTKPFEVLEVKARVRSLLKAKAYADAVKAAAERDLRIAREIQMGLLPADIAAETRGMPLDVHPILEPAQKVGGDLFEVLRLADSRLLVAVGDVSGKGIPAALFMAVAMTLLRSMARDGHPPEVILRRLNDELFAQNPRGMFVTLQCLVFDVAARRITGASAGHHAAVGVTPGQPPRLVFTTSGRVLGLIPGGTYTSETIELRPEKRSWHLPTASARPSGRMKSCTAKTDSSRTFRHRQETTRVRRASAYSTPCAGMRRGPNSRTTSRSSRFATPMETPHEAQGRPRPDRTRRFGSPRGRAHRYQRYGDCGSPHRQPALPPGQAAAVRHAQRLVHGARLYRARPHAGPLHRTIDAIARPDAPRWSRTSRPSS